MTNYNEAINYNAPINYNGVVSPVTPPTNIAGGFVNHPYHREKPRKKDDEIMLMLMEMLDDDYYV